MGSNTVAPKERREFYMVKYALSGGIECVIVDDRGRSGGYTYVVERNGAKIAYPFLIKINGNLFTTREAAEDAARNLAVRKIASLEKQLDKMRKLAKTPKWAKGSDG
jgi:hypothetical protein